MSLSLRTIAAVPRDCSNTRKGGGAWLGSLPTITLATNTLYPQASSPSQTRQERARRTRTDIRAPQLSTPTTAVVVFPPRRCVVNANCAPLWHKVLRPREKLLLHAERSIEHEDRGSFLHHEPGLQREVLLARAWDGSTVFPKSFFSASEAAAFTLKEHHDGERERNHLLFDVWPMPTHPFNFNLGCS